LLRIRKAKNREERSQYGSVAGMVGIVSNAILFAVKLAAGIISGSIAIIADALNNFSDAGVSGVTYAGFKLSAKPADKEHPYGHARYEYIAGLVAALAIFAMGVVLGKTSIDKILAPDDLSVSIFTYVVLIAAAVLKLVQMVVYIVYAKATGSDLLRISATDSRNDVITTLAALAAILIYDKTGQNLDGVFALIVSIFIVGCGVKLIKKTVSPLLGDKPDKQLIAEIKEKILAYDGVLGLHDLMLHNYGPSKCYAVVDIEIAADKCVMDCHLLADKIEKDFKEQMDIHLSVHIDPIDRSDALYHEIDGRLQKVIHELGEGISTHDLTVVEEGDKVHIAFDAAIPFGSGIGIEKIEERLIMALEPNKEYIIKIDLDRI